MCPRCEEGAAVVGTGGVHLFARRCRVRRQTTHRERQGGPQPTPGRRSERQGE